MAALAWRFPFRCSVFQLFNFNCLKVKYLNPFPALIFTVLALACAKVGSLQGGAKDTVPPEVVADGSTPNFTTRFTARRIELRFNEWVTLSDIAAQVLISPPMTPRPQVVLKGKTVRVELDKACELRPNTTYAMFEKADQSSKRMEAQ